MRLVKSVILIVAIVISPMMCQGQGLPIDRFCEIYADSASKRVDKIIRVFKLIYRPAEQLSGKAKCRTGEIFILKTSCMSNNRVAILSLSHPDSKNRPSGATRLFHLKTRKSGDESYTQCLKTTPQTKQ